MNSDLGSPTESQSSSESPPGETSPYVPPIGGSNYLSNLTSHITATFAGGATSSSKRRLPPGSSFGAASSARDPKSRRREREQGRPGHPWEKESGGPGKKEPKDDLLDQALVEHLRKGMSVSPWYVLFNIDPCIL